MRDNSVYSGAQSLERLSISWPQKQNFVDYTNKRTHLPGNKARFLSAGFLAEFPYN